MVMSLTWPIYGVFFIPLNFVIVLVFNSKINKINNNTIVCVYIYIL